MTTFFRSIVIFLMLGALAQVSYAKSHDHSKDAHDHKATHDHHSGHSGGEHSGTGYVDHGPDMVMGEIRRVDRAGKKLIIHHEAIKQVKMPAMTMAFRLQDKDLSLLDKLKTGDKIQFKAVKVHGQLGATDISVVR